MSRQAIGHRVFQVVVFTVAAFMAWGGGFFRAEALPDNLTRTVTYTLYRTLPPPPDGPSFCHLLSVGDYGLVEPCDHKPPFLWWLHKRQFI